MTDLIPPEGATQEQIDAFLASLREDARKHVRERLSAGASAAEIAEYIASLEAPSADEVSPNGDEL
jgi:hypothetical protein